MPTYEYLCEKCGHTFDVFQSMTADALQTCPKEHCGRRRWGRGKVRRVIGGGAGLIFKGNGFYITDYRSEAYKSAAKKDSPTTSSSSSSSTGNGSKGSTGSSAASPAPSTTKSAAGTPAK